MYIIFFHGQTQVNLQSCQIHKPCENGDPVRCYYDTWGFSVENDLEMITCVYGYLHWGDILCFPMKWSLHTMFTILPPYHYHYVSIPPPCVHSTTTMTCNLGTHHLWAHKMNVLRMRRVEGTSLGWTKGTLVTKTNYCTTVKITGGGSTELELRRRTTLILRGQPE